MNIRQFIRMPPMDELAARKSSICLPSFIAQYVLKSTLLLFYSIFDIHKCNSIPVSFMLDTFIPTVRIALDHFKVQNRCSLSYELIDLAQQFELPGLTCMQVFPFGMYVTID